MMDFPHNTTNEALFQVLILVTVAIAFTTDLHQRRIFNALTFPAMVLGLTVHTLHDGPGGLVWSIAGLLLGAALFCVPVTMGGRGAGDLKLLAALGALGGPAFVFWCALYTSIAGGVFAVIALLVSRRLVSVICGMVQEAGVHRVPRTTSNLRIPYAVPIAVGAVVTLAVR
ncbi:MAG: prepilin peptidase [Chloroflexota bacterium]|nr:prepilin peptidase [Chloroflexota bacterium]